MKKIFVLMASAAVLFAACNKMEEVNTPVDTPVETETITVVLNPVTKTSLGAEGTTTWLENDAVDVIHDGNKVGTLTHVGDSKFTGELTTVGLTGEVTLHYPAGVDAVPTTQPAVAGSFADDAAILEGTVDLDVLRAGEGASLSNTTALLKFTVAQAGDVTFEVGTAKYTVTGCETDKTYYACVAPASNAAFTARIGGYLSKKASNKATFTANQVANLGALPAPEVYTWGLVGQHQGWNITNPTKMYKVADNAYACLNIKLQSNGFKFAKTGLSDWNTSNTYFGAWKNSGSGYFNFTAEMSSGDWYGVYTNNLGGQSENIGVSNFNNYYDVYVKIVQDAEWGQELGYTIVEHGTSMTF